MLGTIYVDLDDVLCETAQHCLRIVEREFGKRVGFEELTVFDLGTSCGLNREERDHLYRIIHEPDELLALTPIPGAIATLREWAELGYDVAIVTGRPPATLAQSREWLACYQVPHTSITMVDKYGRFEITGTEAIALHDLSRRHFAWAVEDSLPMARFLAHEMNLQVALLDRPWNRSMEIHTNVARHEDWRTIAEFPRQIER